MNGNDGNEQTPDDDATDTDAVVGAGMDIGSAASSEPGVIDSADLNQ